MSKRCPFCEPVFEIGDTTDDPLAAHIRATHGDSGEMAAGPSRRPNRSAD